MGSGVTVIETADLVGFTSEPAFTLNGDMRVLSWNSGAEEFLGYSTAEAVGRKCAEVLQASYPTGEPLCSVICEGRSCMVVGNKWSITACKIRHKTGKMLTAGISTLVLPLQARKDSLNDAVAVIFLRETRLAGEDTPSALPLRIFTLGHFSVAIAGQGLDVDGWKRKQAAVVLKCLVNHLDRPVHRERLIEWLWPDADPERGWERLKVTISFLRGKLRQDGSAGNPVETVSQSYLLRRDSVWVDSEAFADLVTLGWDALKQGNRTGALAHFEEAKTLYRGDYMEDEPYAEWCAEERQRLREIYLELLAGMAECYAGEGLFMQASQVCRAALTNDPCRENFVRVLLECLVGLGQPKWAKAQFTTWRLALEKEYGLTPTRETLRTYQKWLG